jgi:hypothetical protein
MAIREILRGIEIMMIDDSSYLCDFVTDLDALYTIN